MHGLCINRDRSDSRAYVVRQGAREHKSTKLARGSLPGNSPPSSLSIILSLGIAFAILISAVSCGTDAPDDGASSRDGNGDVEESAAINGTAVATRSPADADRPSPTTKDTPRPITENPLEGDWAALVALYEATHGDRWEYNTNWLTDVPISNWQGVVTDDSGNVTKLVLSRNRLRGEIPPELGSLGELRDLDLSYNNLSGEIPPELGKLGNLETLDLSYNHLAGPIPPELGDIEYLTHVHLFSNALSGEIPRELGELEWLESLGVRGADMTGCIPASLIGKVSIEGASSLVACVGMGDIRPEGVSPEDLAWTRASCVEEFRSALVADRNWQDFNHRAGAGLSEAFAAAHPDCVEAGWAPRFAEEIVCRTMPGAGVHVALSMQLPRGRSQLHPTMRVDSDYGKGGGSLVIHFERLPFSDIAGCWSWFEPQLNWHWYHTNATSGMVPPRFRTCEEILQTEIAEASASGLSVDAGLVTALIESIRSEREECGEKGGPGWDYFWTLGTQGAPRSECSVQSPTGATPSGDLAVHWQEGQSDADGSPCWVLSAEGQWEIERPPVPHPDGG